jgi:hypothetical protein
MNNAITHPPGHHVSVRGHRLSTAIRSTRTNFVTYSSGKAFTLFDCPQDPQT